MKGTRLGFTHTALLAKINESFKQSTQSLNRQEEMPASDCLMSGLAIFALKYPSLLKFEEDKVSEPTIRHNLKTLYSVKKAPCDTYLWERLDRLNLSVISSALVSICALLQRGKVLEEWKFLENKFLVSLDASGFFSSNKVWSDPQKLDNPIRDKSGT